MLQRNEGLGTDLTERQLRLLRLIVSDYIASASPVGSETVARRHGLGLSSATIRHDMALLEEEGYIAHPHTSAGRIPLDRGYRLYAESFADDVSLPVADRRRIRHQFYQVEGAPEEWVRLAGNILARLVQNLALVTFPRAPQARLKDIRLVALQEFLALLVVILQEARLRHQMVGFADPLTQEELDAIAQRLTAAFQGMSAAEIEASPVEFAPAEQQVRQAVVHSLTADEAPAREDIHLEGLSAFLRQPEFSTSPDGERLLAIMEVLETRSALQTLVTRARAARDLQVIIGSENPREELQDYSIVLMSYGIPGEAQGTIGVLGPTRMSYPRVIASVRYLGSVLSELVREIAG